MAKSIFIIAGEESGDLLGGALMHDLKALEPELVFSGVGGMRMIEEGLHSIFPMHDLSVMGLAEVVKHLPRLIGRINQTVKAVLKQQPDLLITIDAPDFCFRVAKKIKRKNSNIKIIHVVAPTVWAWRPGRAKKIAQLLDGLLCLFPFESRYFIPYGLKTQFIGHPLERLIAPVNDEAKHSFCQDHHLNNTQPILCLLPGSRTVEITLLLPLLLQVAENLKKNNPDLQIILPTLPHKEKIIKDMISDPAIHVFVPKDNAEKYVAFAVSTAALHASGTVALELALCGTPMVTTYKASKLTAAIMRRLIKTPHINLVNILLNHPVVPELIQEEATVKNLTATIQALLSNEVLRNLQKEQLQAVRDSLKENAPQAAAHFMQSFL